jgi:hypothetical protein
LVINYQISSTQSPNWNWAISSDGLSDEIISDISLDNDGNVLICGEYIYDEMSFCNNNFKFRNSNFIIKLDNAGECIWAKYIGSEMGGTDHILVKNNNDNEIYIVGTVQGEVYFDGLKISSYPNDYAGFILKLDPNGNLIWSERILVEDKYVLSFLSLAVDQNNNIYITGATGSTKLIINNIDYLLNNISPYTHSFILKLNTSNNIDWIKSFQCNGIERISKIAVDVDNNIIVCGVYSSGISNNNYIKIDSFLLYNKSRLNKCDLFIAKISSEGKAIWASSIGGLGDEYGGDLAIDKVNKNIYFLASFNTDTLLLGNKIHMRESKGIIRDYFLMKINNNGSIEWSITNYFGVSPYGWFSITIDSNENIYSHYHNSLSKVIFNKDTFYKKYVYSNILIALDKNSNYLWGKSYECDAYIGPGLIVSHNNGSLIVTGEYTANQLILGKDTLINRGRDIGRGTPRNIFIAELKFDTITKTIQPDGNHKQLIVYPNPASQLIHIDLGINVDAVKKLELLDIFGNKHITEFEMIQNNILQIQISKLTPGIYFIKLISNCGEFFNKFIIQN